MDIKIKRKIKDLPKVERPREKLMQYSPEKLSNLINNQTEIDRCLTEKSDQIQYCDLVRPKKKSGAS